MIQPHETWNIHDSSKIETYMSCPRKYFYQYVLGWREDKPSEHLIFGEAWHLAMEHMLIHGYTQEAILAGYMLLEHKYREAFNEETDDQRFPKVPGMGLMGLVEYAKEYEPIDKGEECLYTEIAGSVPVLREKRLNFRMDSIIRKADSLIISREHKTAGSFSRQWIDQWKLKIQLGTYLHVLYCLYKADEVWGVQINGAAFQKGKKSAGEIKFHRELVRKTPEMMEDWICTVMYWLDRIEEDFSLLLGECTENDTVLRAFTKNPTACTDYFGCEYMDLCLAWANPLRHIFDLPIGFHTEYWNPADYQLTAKKVVTI
jgi:hypothetical protein